MTVTPTRNEAEAARGEIAASLHVDPASIEVGFELVTPATARSWLATNAPDEDDPTRLNRPISESRVQVYARDIHNDNWFLTGESIAFDRDGNLADGQHRLAAIVEANKPVTLLVVRGLDPAARAYMDTGVKRTMGHVLAMRGETDANVLAAVAVLVWQWSVTDMFQNMSSGGSRTVTHGEILQVIEQNPGLRECIAYVRARKINGITISAAAFALYKLRQIDREQADQFIADLAEIRTTGAGDPKSALLRRIASAQNDRVRIDRYNQVKLLFRAWNAQRRGEEMRRMPIWTRRSEVIPEEPI